MNTDNQIIVSPDHDILITLVGTVKTNHEKILEKIADIKTDVKEIKDGTAVQLSDHEKRIGALESLNNKYPAESLVPEFKKLQQDFHDQNLTTKERVRLAAVVSSTVTFILTIVSAILGIVTGAIQLGG